MSEPGISILTLLLQEQSEIVRTARTQQSSRCRITLRYSDLLDVLHPTNRDAVPHWLG